ncbi:MAG: DUF2460 domain-containing protein [Elusimicrobia bacterium]|nr:DUF2460 domain-containing protein [Elusimicrobiota bacterium]
MTTTFPTLNGLGWDIKKRVIWSNNVETTASGAEFRTGFWTAPIYEFDLQFNYLSQTDQQTLETFYEARKGSYEAFYLAVANDPSSPFLVRFKDDQLEFNQMLSQFYEAQTVTFRTVR